MTEKVILKENCDGHGGYISIDKDKLTPEFLAKLKADKIDEMGWNKYRKLMKEKGYDIE